MMAIKIKTLTIGEKRKSRIILGILIIMFTGLVNSQNGSTKNIPHIDKSIRSGQLSNGMRYFIKSVPDSGNKLYLKMHHLVGSDQEDLDQLNFAHAVEHMAFKPTEHFPAGVNNSPLSEMGIGIYNFGGSSGRKTTTYNFEFPLDNDEALDLGFLWFSDIIEELKMYEADIAQVRGELRQEFLIKSGEDVDKLIAEMEIYARLFPCSRSYINFFEHHESFDSEELRRFYRKWYRPDLMAIVVVGKIEDLNHIENKIEENFSHFSKAEFQKRKNCSNEYNSRPPQYAVVERKVNSSILVYNEPAKFHLFFRDDNLQTEAYTKRGLENGIKRQILISVIKRRLEESTMDYGSFTSHIYDSHTSSDLPVAMELVVTTRIGEEKNDIQKNIKMLHQLQEYGLTELEWHEVKQHQFGNLKSRNPESARYWLDEIESYLTKGEILPAGKTKYVEEWLQELSLSEFNAFVHQYLKSRSMDIGVQAPSGHKALEYSDEEVRSWIKKAYQEPVEPYVAPDVISSLMVQSESAPQSKVGYEDMGIGESGSREIILDNGVKVVLRPTTSPSRGPSQIRIRGYSLKGAECVLQEDFFSAINAPRIVQHSGVNGLNVYQINNFLESTSLMPGSVFPYIDEKETGIYANGKAADLEIMLQLIYLYFTRPNKDRIAFQDWKKKEQVRYANPSYSLSLVDFFNEIKSFTNDNSLNENYSSKSFEGTKFFKTGQETDLDIAFNIYSKLFATAKDFTFLVEGSFEEDDVLPLFKQYLGNLKNSEKPLSCASHLKKEKTLTIGPVYKEIFPPEYYNMINTRYALKFLKEADMAEQWKEEIKIEALAEVISHEAWKLRWEKDYALYMVGVFGNYNAPMDRFEITFLFETEPEELAKIQQEVEDIISRVKAGDLPMGSFQTGMNRIYNIYGINGSPNWLMRNDGLYRFYRYGLPLVEHQEVKAYVKSLTSNDLIELANEYFTDEYSFEFVMGNPME